MSWNRSRMLPCLAALALVAFGCRDEVPVDATPARPVVVTPVELVSLEERIESTGELLAKNRATVAAQVDGEITEVLVEEGEAVEEGDVVLRIDPERRSLERDRAAAHVAELEATVAEQRRERGRVRTLAQQKVASQTRLDQAETELRTHEARLAAARAELGVAERALRDANVDARFPGLIARRHVNRGEFVAPGRELFELVSLDPVEVEFHVPESDSSRVRQGMPIDVTLAPFPGEVFNAIVTVVSPIIDPRTRTLRIRAVIPNAEGRLRPGLFARIDLGVSRREGVMMVPEEAVLQRADGPVVFRVVGDDRVERRSVETAVVHGGRVEIVSGLDPGDRVVQRGHADLIDGSVIVARHPDGTPVATAVSGGLGEGLQ